MGNAKIILFPTKNGGPAWNDVIQCFTNVDTVRYGDFGTKGTRGGSVRFEQKSLGARVRKKKVKNTSLQGFLANHERETKKKK